VRRFDPSARLPGGADVHKHDCDEGRITVGTGPRRPSGGDAVSELFDKRLVFVTGKGGVGRTTVAAALGLAAAERGKRVIVCEVAQHEHLSRTFRRDAAGFSETELRERLYSISIDPRQALEEYLAGQMGSQRLSSLLTGNRIFDYFVAAAPGVKELATIGMAWEVAQLERRRSGATPYDLAIVDAPASGHGLAMLTTPRTYAEVARVGPIRRRARMIEDFVTDPSQTGYVAVSLAQEMPVTETIEFTHKLRDELGMTPDAVVVNALLPERFSAEEAAEIARAAAMNGSSRLSPVLRAALAEHRRARGQRAQLRRLRRATGGALTLPFLFTPELGTRELETLAARLVRKL
jgi:anion-transporting  ArsA/GET3 family ATPase